MQELNEMKRGKALQVHCVKNKTLDSHRKQQTGITQLLRGRTHGFNVSAALFISVIGSFVFKWGSGQGSWCSALIFIAPSGAREVIGLAESYSQT